MWPRLHEGVSNTNQLVGVLLFKSLIMVDIEDDTIKLLSVKSSEEEEQEKVESEIVPFSYSEEPSPKIISEPNASLTINQRSPNKKKAADFPFSIEDKSSSVNINVPRRQSLHHVQRPTQKKIHRWMRWVCGIGTAVVLAGLVAVAITLVVIATDEDTSWWHKSVIYQCYPQSFQDSDGDGVGDLEGIRSRVSYFRDTGIKAVWLNPIFESPQQDNGYDISNYTAIDQRYGTMHQFIELLNDLHDNGIHLLLDFVPNHTSDEHPWFIESRSNKVNPKRNWYIWANGSSEDDPPNNWISVFGNSSWTYDPLTDQWYLHQFSPFQPDLNYSNPEVRKAMKDVLKFWLDIGVDGFRVDAVKFLLEDPQLRDEVRNPDFPSDECLPDNISDSYCYNSLIHNLTTNYPGIHTICQEWRQLLNEYSIKSREEKIFIGEIYDSIDQVMLYFGNGSNEFTFPFNFFLLDNRNWTGISVNCVIKKWLDNMPTLGTANWVLSNHDNPRVASRVGVYLAKALNVLLLTLPGTPTTYYGEEILMTDVDIPSAERKDKYEGRDAERTPMQWNTSNNSGFTFPHVTPWLPLATNYTLYNVEVEMTNSYSMLQLYKQLLTLRTAQAFLEGDYQCLNATQEILVYMRYQSDSQDYKENYIIAINFSKKNLTTSVNLSLTHTELLVSTYPDRDANTNIDLSSFQLRSGEGLVIRGYSSEQSCQKVKVIESQSCKVCST